MRNALFALSGELDTTMGGPEVDSAAPRSRRGAASISATRPTTGCCSRSVDADPEECYRRIESVVPQQALALTHGGLSLAQARIVARKLSASSPRGRARRQMPTSS